VSAVAYGILWVLCRALSVVFLRYRTRGVEQSGDLMKHVLRAQFLAQGDKLC